MFWPFNKFKAWRVQRQETVVAKRYLKMQELT